MANLHKIQFERRIRSVLKASSHRLTSSLITMGIVWTVIREPKTTVAIGASDIILKWLIYYFHERVWNKIHIGKETYEPAVIWFTGLSGAGKTTLAHLVRDHLSKKGFAVEVLDGDEIRSLFPLTGFSKADREQHVMRVGALASRLEKNGIVVLASLISPYRDSRDFVRRLCKNFIEIHVATPLEECIARDPKGLYQKALNREILQFTGISDPYEEPLHPELRIDTLKCTPEKEAEFITQFILKSMKQNLSSPLKSRLLNWALFSRFRIPSAS